MSHSNRTIVVTLLAILLVTPVFAAIGIKESVSNTLNLSTNNVERIIVDSSGNVNITTGNLNVQNGVLSIAGTTRISSTGVGTFAAGTTIGGGSVLTGTGSTNNVTIWTGASTLGAIPSTGSGSVVFSNSPVFTTPNIGSATGSISGNAGTATALAADPADCAANTWATTIGTTGALTCSAITYAGITAMTSANFAGLITDESGTGSVAFTNSPVFTTPNIGSATGSISGNAGTVTNGIYTTSAWSGGDLTGTGLAATVAANSVALGTDTTGGYAASSTEGGAATITGTTLTATGTGMSITGDTATRSGGGAWDAQVYSTDGYTKLAYVSAKLDSISYSYMFGLNTDPTLDSSYCSLDYAWYITASSSAYIYENCGQAAAAVATLAAGDTLAVVYDGTNVKYLQNGVVRRTVAAAIASPLYFDSSFVNGASPSSTISNIRVGSTMPSTLDGMSSTSFSGTGACAGGAAVTTLNGAAAPTCTTFWNSGNDGVGSNLDADYVDGLSSNSFSGTGACGANTAVTTLNGAAAPTCSSFWNSANDGAASGLDADLLDGLSSASFSGTGACGANTAVTTINGAASPTCSSFWNSANDGTGSGLDADTLDGQDSTAYQDKPGSWTCTLRSATSTDCGTSCYSTVTVSCSGSEKAIAGGCSVDSGGWGDGAGYINGPDIDRPTGQGWTCAGYAPNGFVYAHANCCQ